MQFKLMNLEIIRKVYELMLLNLRIAELMSFID